MKCGITETSNISWIFSGWDFELDGTTIISYDPKLKENIEQVLEYVGSNALDGFLPFHESGAYDDLNGDRPDDEFNEIMEQFESMDDPYQDLYDAWNNSSTFPQFWKQVKNLYRERKPKPKTTKIILNEYCDAYVRSDSITVEIGSRNIHIDQIRKVVEEYDKLVS